MKQIFLKSLPIFFVAALCMCLTSCGGGDDDGSSPSNTPSPTSGTEGQNGSGQGGQQLGNPLTLEAIGSGTITFKNRAAGPVSYRIDNGNIQTIAAGTDGQISVRADQKVTLFGDNATYFPGNEPSNISSTTDFYAYGNIMSLINSNNYNTATTLTDSHTFASLFEGNTKLRSHPNIPLLLPATNLSEGCYYYMFYGCTSLTTAPVLPAKTLADHCYYCYDYMFYGCSSLNYVKCLAEGDVDNFLFTDSWLEGVAPSGTFVKAPGASWNKVSSSCIPSGWTVVENTEQEGQDGEDGYIHLCPDENHPHMIDLGLPSGTKWACCNLGASEPEGYGDYYAWGETTTKGSYTLNNYKYYNNGSYVDIGSNIAGTKYDAATANWGAKWMMPTYVQTKELFDNTTLEWITMDGTNGIKLVGKNRNSIFLPEAGNWEESLNSAGKAGYYTTASFYERNGSYTSNYAALVCFHDGEIIWGSHGSLGVSIRPVSKK